MKNILLILSLMFLTACSQQTHVVNQAEFVGEGKYWEAVYTYDADLYDEKHVNWVEIALKNKDEHDIDINDIDVKLKSRDGTITGHLGEMITKIGENTNTIKFLVGTVNSETYEADKYELTINFDQKKDVLKLKLKK